MLFVSVKTTSIPTEKIFQPKKIKKKRKELLVII
jgi:hypothetical protein